MDFLSNVLREDLSGEENANLIAEVLDDIFHQTGKSRYELWLLAEQLMLISLDDGTNFPIICTGKTP